MQAAPLCYYQGNQSQKENFMEKDDPRLKKNYFFEENKELIVYNRSKFGQEIIKKSDIWLVAIQTTDKGSYEHDIFWLIFHLGSQDESSKIPIDNSIKGHDILWNHFKTLKEFKWDKVKQASEVTENQFFVVYKNVELEKTIPVHKEPIRNFVPERKKICGIF